MFIKNSHCFANTFDCIHSGTQNNRLAKGGNVFQQRIIIAFSRTNFVGRNIKFSQAIGGGTGKRGRHENHPFIFDVVFQFQLIGFIEGTTFHDFINRNIGIARDYFFGSAAHFVFHDMGLVFDHFHSGTMGSIDHFFGYFQRPFMVNTNFGNDQGWVIGTYFSFCYCYVWVHKKVMSFELCLSSLDCARDDTLEVTNK